MHEHIPRVTVDLSQQQAFDNTSAGIAMTDQARRNDARVVDDEKVVPRQERRKVRNALMSPPGDGAIDHEQPRGAALRGGRLRDELRRKIEGEIRKAHAL